MFSRQFALPLSGVPERFPADYETDREELILAEARAIAHRRLQNLVQISDPKDAGSHLIDRFQGQPEELFTGLFLDTRHRVLCFEVMFRGSIDGCQVHSREVVRTALQVNAAAVIFAHNHPSGVPEPSAADRAITRRLVESLQLVDVRVLDHFVIGGSHAVSLAARGWL